MEKELTIGGMFREGIPLGLKNAASIIGATLLWLITFWIPYLNVGTTIALQGIVATISKGGVISPTEIFNPKYRKYMGEFFLVTIFLSVGTIIGVAFLVIPGIVIGIAWSQAILLVLDKGINPINALKVSNDITYGKKAIIFFGPLLVGLVCLIVPLIVAGILQDISETLAILFLVIVALLFSPVMTGVRAYIYGVLSKGISAEKKETPVEEQAEELPETELSNASSPTPAAHEEVVSGTTLQENLKPFWQSLTSLNLQQSESFAKFMKPVIKLVIGLVSLLIIRYIVSVIPMVKDARVSGMPVTPLQIVRAVINTVILVVLLNFGRELKRVGRNIFQKFTEVGDVANMVVILITICIAYTVYDELVYRLLLRGRYSWIYPVFFLCIALIPIYLLGSTLYKNIDKFTELLAGKLQTDAEEEAIVCSNCGEPLGPDTKFCPNCGQPVSEEEAEAGNI